jgi:hypothetical protein
VRETPAPKHRTKWLGYDANNPPPPKVTLPNVFMAWNESDRMKIHSSHTTEYVHNITWIFKLLFWNSFHKEGGGGRILTRILSLQKVLIRHNQKNISHDDKSCMFMYIFR